MTIIVIASYLEPHLVECVRQEFPEITVINRPDLFGEPRFEADHTAPINRSAEQEAEWRSLLQQADILFDFDKGNLDKLPQLAPNLKWIQATSAGIGQLVKRYGYDRHTDWIFTTASGVHGRALAEFALMAMTMFAKDYVYLQQEKADKHWGRYCTDTLQGKTLGVIGLGKIGRDVANLGKALDMHVIGTRRDVSIPTEHVDQLYLPDQVDELLPLVDYLVLAAPHTPETDGLIGKAQLDLLRSTAVLINIARGAMLDETALIEALQTGTLRGAALDVFEVEPLPQDSPLWEMPNVIISPHSASTIHGENARIVDIFCENIRRFLAGEPMVNVLDTEKLY